MQFRLSLQFGLFLGFWLRLWDCVRILYEFGFRSVFRFEFGFGFGFGFSVSLSVRIVLAFALR